MQSLKNLNEAGIADILLNAIIVLRERGHTRGITHNPKTGNIDARGALLLATGAKPANISGFITTPEEAKIPEYWLPKAYAAIELVENMVGDIEEWNDNPNTTQQEIEKTFKKLATMLQIAVI